MISESICLCFLISISKSLSKSSWCLDATVFNFLKGLQLKKSIFKAFCSFYLTEVQANVSYNTTASSFVQVKYKKLQLSRAHNKKWYREESDEEYLVPWCHSLWCTNLKSCEPAHTSLEIGCCSFFFLMPMGFVSKHRAFYNCRQNLVLKDKALDPIHDELENDEDGKVLNPGPLQNLPEPRAVAEKEKKVNDASSTFTHERNMFWF